jgi:hypothetical protein
MTMIVAGLYLVVDDLMWAPRIVSLYLIGGATLAALGAYLLWEEFINAI